MRDRLRKLNRLIDDAITISETMIDWKFKHGLIFSNYLAGSILALLQELGHPRAYTRPESMYQDDVPAFVKFLQSTQESVATVLETFHQQAVGDAIGHQNHGKGKKKLSHEGKEEVMQSI